MRTGAATLRAVLGRYFSVSERGSTVAREVRGGLVATGTRQAVFNAVPAALKAAIAVGIGLFICFIGLVYAGFVRRLPDAAGTTVPVGLGLNGSIATWPTGVFAVGLIITVALVARRIRGAILVGVLATAVLAIIVEAVVHVGPSASTNPRGWSLGYPAVPDRIFGMPDLSLVGDFSLGAFFHVPILTVVLLVFTLVLTDFFNSIGTLTGLGKEAGFIRPDGARCPLQARRWPWTRWARRLAVRLPRRRTPSTSSPRPGSRKGPVPAWPVPSRGAIGRRGSDDVRDGDGASSRSARSLGGIRSVSTA